MNTKTIFCLITLSLTLLSIYSFCIERTISNDVSTYYSIKKWNTVNYNDCRKFYFTKTYVKWGNKPPVMLNISLDESIYDTIKGENIQLLLNTTYNKHSNASISEMNISYFRNDDESPGYIVKVYYNNKTAKYKFDPHLKEIKKGL